ncbi:MAG: diacylglycerol kinase family lipid kinase [Alistipes sp.]|nr:diacylglycerol kinase family lipid kinase [Alistipes sp.]
MNTVTTVPAGPDKWFAIINPVAGSGRGLKDWPVISRLLRERGIMPDFAFTERKYHAIEIAVEAVNNGYRRIIVVGGDGTIHEVVNGLFIQKTVPTTDVLISVVAVGTGNDWIRMFGIPRKYSEAIKAISDGHSFLQDVATISFFKSQIQHERYMANVAGIGFDAFVNQKYNQLKDEGKYSKWLYMWSAFKSVMQYSSTGVRIWLDDKLIVNELVYSGTIGIGKYNGGGMIQMPDAVADDGLLDLTVIRKISLPGVLRHFKSLYNGKIYKIKKVSLNRGRRIRIESTPEIRVEVDGEALGYSPFEFQIIDRAIKVIVSEKFLREEVKKRAN